MSTITYQRIATGDEPPARATRDRPQAMATVAPAPRPEPAAPVPILLGLGANLGQRRHNLEAALDLLAPDCGPFIRSSIYETPPWGDSNQPRFLNLVVLGQTRLAPMALLERLKAVEAQLGRRPTHRWGPRVIDIDLLAYGDALIDSPELTVPHPRLHERGFVLVPLAELLPEWRHPAFGRTAAELLAELPPSETSGIKRL